jgi:hypothetical protein
MNEHHHHMETDWFTIPTHWPAQTDLLRFCQNMGMGMAMLLLLAGVIYLLWGAKIYHWLVLLNAGVVGAISGASAGRSAGIEIPMAIAGALLAVAIAWPLMKWAVAVMGGIFGAILGGTIWRLCNLDPNFMWTGALVGLITFGLLSFILFHACVVMYTSLQGAVMLIFAVLGMLYRADLSIDLTRHMAVRPFLLPMAVFVPTVIGIIYQQNYSFSGGGGAQAKK